MSTHAVDELARLAANADPPLLDDHAARRLVERALVAPRLDNTHVVERRTLRWVPVAATAIAFAALAVVLLRPALHTAEPQLVHVALPTGDQLVGTHQARFAVERIERADRRVRLESGTVLAEVARVATGQRFAIVTAHLIATAKGTIFSVETDAVRTRVRVFEGIVEITQDGASRLLGAGTMWSSDAHVLAFALDRPAVLAADISDALERRAVASPVVASARVPAVDARAVDRSSDAAASAPVVEATAVVKPIEPRPASHTASASSHEPELSLEDLLARARGELAAGKLDAALATATLAEARGAQVGAWRIIRADALRGLGRAAEAADAYAQAARELSGSDAFEAGYSAAYLRFKELHDYDRALDALVAARVDSADSPLEERGLALHAQILVAAKRGADARPIAERYLARYPHGELRAMMQSLRE